MPPAFPMRGLAGAYVRLLRRILRRLFEVLFSHLEVMLRSYRAGVAEPCADDVRRSRMIPDRSRTQCDAPLLVGD